MGESIIHHQVWRLGVLVIGMLVAAGCQVPLPEVVSAELEPNDDFSSARAISFALDASSLLTGAITREGDVDVYDLGPLAAGDQVTLQLQRRSSQLRASLALYDDEGELIDEDTLTSVQNSLADPLIRHVLRADVDNCFVAVSHGYDRVTTGAYDIIVRIDEGRSLPAPEAVTVLLNFDGGLLDQQVLGRQQVAPFDAGATDPLYAGQDGFIRDTVVATIRQNYARFNITFAVTGIDESPASPHSEVLFGGFNGIALGAAQSVDLYNQIPADKAVIFTESFEPNLFPRAPSAAELAIAIGNVASHELGHLLGLHHVNDPTALLDEASPAITLLLDQEFKSASLAASIFPLGRHDSADLLEVTLGINPNPPTATRIDRGPLVLVDFGLVPGASVASRAKCLNCAERAQTNWQVRPIRCPAR